MKRNELLIKILIFPLTIVLISLLSSCEHIEYGEIETYCVPEDAHKSNFPNLVLVDSEIHAKVYFHASCRYAPQPAGLSGWNKLFGLQTGVNPRTNSARWAWRYDHENDMIKLATYVWINGLKPTEQNGGIEYIFSVPLEHGDFLTGEDWTELYVCYEHGWWKLLGGYGGTLGSKKNVPGLGEGFLISPLYFGGNDEASHETCVSYIFGERKGFRLSTDR